MNQKRNNDELLTTVFGSKEVLEPAPTDVIPQGMMRPEIAYQIVKDETYPQTQPRLNLATFVTTYMDEYATRLMNEAISVNYIDETEYPRIAVMNGRCINMIANLWNTPEKAQWKAGALGIGSSEACMLGGVAAWLRWRKRRQAAGKLKVLENFVSVQSDAALRQVAGYYAYDNNGVADDELTLRSNSDEINDQLEAKLNDRLSMAGIEVIEARINYLAYAPEIAAVMLRRQQADAIISAREKIVEGAVTMVKMALDRLADDRIVELDEERKAAMVSNLLVVLCADEAAQPIVNAGTLHH